MSLPEEIWNLDESMAVVMMRIRKSLRRQLREAICKEELSQNEIEVLLFLGHKHSDTAKDITQYRGISRSLVSKSVDSLVKRGYLEVRQDENDRRVIHLLLLPKAEETVNTLGQARLDFMRRLCGGITKEETAAFMAVVEKMANNVMENLPEENVDFAEK